jgi:hypothetical protein
VTNKEDVALTFSDEDFEKRYSSQDAVPAASGAAAGSRTAQPLAISVVRSRNRFMRTLLRRRMASSVG